MTGRAIRALARVARSVTLALMKAWQIESFGPGGLFLRDREEPAPRAGQARVRMRAWSLNYRDVLIVNGAYDPRMRLPVIPLSDGVGVVEAVGEGVTRVAVGDRVSAAFAPKWIAGAPHKDALRSALGSPGDGVAAEVIAIDAEGLVSVPAYLSDEEAATLPCAAVTAWNALYEAGDLRPGQTVLVEGTGGVSMFALQLARLGGARVIATSSHEDKRARAIALGAFAAIDYVADRAWGKTARDLAGGGVDHVVEVGGAGTIEQALIAVKPGGTISVIGVLDGAVGPIALTRVLMNAVRLQGIIVGPREAFERMNVALEAHELRPVVDRVLGFDELPAAIETMKSGKHFGKIVLKHS